MTEITINTEYIKLGALLKFAGLTGTGGEASIVIKDGLVKLNGEVCTQKGHKVRSGDKVELEGETLVIAGGGGSG